MLFRSSFILFTAASMLCGAARSLEMMVLARILQGIGGGGLLGGIVGHQVGAGRGRDIATAVGAVGGAIAGNQVERGRNTTSHYEVTVRFDDNTTQRLTLNEAPAWRPGDRVRIVGGAAGNLIDRVRFGFVVDFVDVYWRDWHFWAFNVADAAITIGVALMILDHS